MGRVRMLTDTIDLQFEQSLPDMLQSVVLIYVTVASEKETLL
jgi:hypothetical protein